MNKLKVAFLVDESKVDYYIADLISYVEDSDLFFSPILILGAHSESGGKIGNKAKKLFSPNLFKMADKIVQIILYKLIRKIELKQVQRRFENYGKVINLDEIKQFERIEVEGDWSKSKISLRFTADDIEKIKSYELDCIIRCGTGILKGEVLSVPKYGVLSLHNGDNRKNRGGPNGFWEVLNNEPSSGFIIQKLNEELDGGEVLVRGNLMTKAFWLQNSAQLHEKSNYFFKKLLKHIANHKSLPLSEGPRLHDKELLRFKSCIPLLKYIAKVLLPRVGMKVTSFFMGAKIGRWGIAYSRHGGFSKSLWRYNEIENPVGRFLADPFVIKKNEKHYIFVEDYFYSEGKGKISAIQVDDKGYEFLGVVLEEPFHLSFPFTFEVDGEIYMIPETSQNKDIRLYKCLDFPMKWALDRVIMDNVSAGDTMVVKRQDKWFMLTNICSAGYGEKQSELHAFFANDFKTNDWQPIGQGNPVMIDSESARNGGFFYHNGTFYRINQIHGKDHYGKSFGVNEVTELNVNTYTEKRVSNINSDFLKGIDSTHHFNANDEFAVVDYCRFMRVNKCMKT
ncbi:hypothetical protein F0237_16730 [Vibrio tubiashii]|uniref:Glucosamine inositolphosphorylceramide transferase 1 N-terminal domain-containing protein n=1 Tax=Vibrio tubiashii TaxID=29498 RepID=A0AAE5GSH5_9VIBR|nr:hypothetical protein [Vibrio tubiashii]NOI82315.1 hypothetical protein [Vibrio tubiashii]